MISQFQSEGVIFDSEVGHVWPKTHSRKWTKTQSTKIEKRRYTRISFEIAWTNEQKADLKLLCRHKVATKILKK